MKVLSLGMLFLGGLVAITSLGAGLVGALPWNTTCLVLFGLGTAYAGLCGLSHRDDGPQESVSE